MNTMQKSKLGRKQDIIVGEIFFKRKEIVFAERVRRISSESNSPKFKTMLLSFNKSFAHFLGINMLACLALPFQKYIIKRSFD